MMITPSRTAVPWLVMAMVFWLVPVRSAQGQEGLLGHYYAGGFADDGDCTPEGAESFQRVDPEIDFNWADGPPQDGFCYNAFTVRWTGTITAEVDGLHLLTVSANDGVRLFLDHELLIEAWWNTGNEPFSAVVEMQAGVPVPIMMDYVEGAGYANVRLLWTPPGGEYEVIPSRVLRPDPVPVPQETTVAVYMVDDLMLEGTLLAPYGRYGLDTISGAVWRMGPLEEELTITLVPQGDALPGVDYALPTYSRELYFGPRESGAVFSIGQVDDAIYRGDRVGEIGIAPSEDFTVHPEFSLIRFDIKEDETTPPDIGYTIAGVIEGGAPGIRWLLRAAGPGQDRVTSRSGPGVFGFQPVEAGTYVVEVFEDADEDGQWGELELGQRREVAVPPHHYDVHFVFDEPQVPGPDAGHDEEDAGAEDTGPADMGADLDGGLDAVADVPEDDATPRDTAELAMEEDAAPTDVPQGEDAAEESPPSPGSSGAEDGCAVAAGTPQQLCLLWLLLVAGLMWRRS